MNEVIGGRPRLNWNPVTDSGGDAPPRGRTDDGDGFAFNLGNALAKLGIDADGHPPRAGDDPLASLRSSFGGAATDVRAPHDVGRPTPHEDELLPRRHAPSPTTVANQAATPSAPPTPPPADELLPRRHAPSPSIAMPDAAAAAPAPPATPPAPPAPRADDGDLDTAPRPYVAPRRSVFDDVVSPSPALPPTVVSGPTAAAETASAPAPGPTLAVAPAPAPAPAAPAVPNAPVLPTLPAAAPAAPPPMASSVTADHTEQADLRALRSVQMRAQRQRRTGKVIGRTILVLILLGCLVAAGLRFGRGYLFPVEWDPALTELVDQIQLERGADFQHTVGLVVQPDDEFDLLVQRLTIGDDWEARVPEWRALGLVAGAPTVAGTAADVADGRLAIYDPATDRVVMASSADVTVAVADLRIALEQAYGAQLGATPITPRSDAALTGVSSTDVIARRAVDRFLARRDAVAGSDLEPRAANLPLPIEYELLAVDVLGEAVLTAAGADPETATFETDVSSVLLSVLDDAPNPATPAPLQVGERALAEPTVLGTDDWSLVWGTALPATTVDRLVDLVTADSYQVIDRGGTTCVVGVFETASPEQAAVVLAAMSTWAQAAPGGVASATSLGETRVQLAGCDPGPDAAVSAPVDAAAALIDRQLVRLAG